MAEERSELAKLLWNRELWRRLRELVQSGERGKIRQLFQELVIDRLRKPASITVGELAANLRHQVAGVTSDPYISDDDWRKIICGFHATSLENEPHDSAAWLDGGELDLGTWLTDEGSDLDKVVECKSLWESEYFFLPVRAIPQVGAGLAGFKLVGTLCYCCPETALDAAKQWMSKYVTSIAKTVACCSVRNERPKTLLEQVLEDEDDNEYGIPPSIPDGGPFSTPFSFLFDERAKGNLVFNECLDALAQIHLDEADPFTRRLGNAVYMLSESDRTESAAVALVLCFTAIEAIVCKKPRKEKEDDWGIDKQIKKLVPALLMRSPRGRGKRGSVLYDLYYTRSSTVHEAKLDADPLELHDARQIAAGVLRATIEWREARTSNEEPSCWDDFYQELYRAATDQLPMRDVSDLSDLLPGERRRREYRQTGTISRDDQPSS